MFHERKGWEMFRLGQVDVSISASYVFVMALILVFSLRAEMIAEGLLNGVFFVMALTISVLIHEFGHAVVCKKYDLKPSILLHGFGGACFHEPASTDGRDTLIVVAGPLIEIAFGFLAFGLLLTSPMIEMGVGSDITGRVVEMVQTFLTYFAWISVIWGAINLFVPLWPLDGGRLFHLILRKLVTEEAAQTWTLRVSVLVCVPVVIWSFASGHYFLALMAVFIGMENMGLLNSGVSLVQRPGKVRLSAWVSETMGEAEEAYQRQDWDLVAQLCHRMRANNDPVPPKAMSRIWEMLAVSAVEMGEFDEAWGWIERAPETTAVKRVRDKLEANAS
jgi:stage IV sporulation protein FB